MLKKLVFAVLALFAAAAFAAVDANKADQAGLETVKGIGPAISGKIVDERKKSPFKDWPDMIERVGGIGDANAAKFSAGGLTVNGAPYKAAPAKAAPAKAEPAKPAVPEAKKDAAKPASAPAKASDKK